MATFNEVLGDSGWIPDGKVYGGFVTSAQELATNGTLLDINSLKWKCYNVTAVSHQDTLTVPGARAAFWASNDPDGTSHATPVVSAANTVYFDVVGGGTDAGFLLVGSSL